VAAQDRELLELAASGDQLAFADLYDRHAETVARYVWAWFENVADVQDIVQETFVTTWQKASSVRIVDSSALPWLLTTSKNHARNRVRKMRTRRESVLDTWSARLADEPLDPDRERMRWILDQMANLSDIDRTICEMCLLEGMTYKEAAAQLGRPVSAVAKRLQRAKARIRKAALTND
jgi:RNA polymerase sigma factor (sigma-70 family)